MTKVNQRKIKNVIERGLARKEFIDAWDLIKIPNFATNGQYICINKTDLENVLNELVEATLNENDDYSDEEDDQLQGSFFNAKNQEIQQ